MKCIQRTSITVLFLALCVGISACSLKPENKNGTTVTISIPAKSKTGQMRVGGDITSIANMSGIPSSISDFACFGVNITGPGIPEFAFGGTHKPTACPGSGTPYFGIIGGLVPASSGGTLTVNVPAGADRLIQVFGIRSSIGCPPIMDIVDSGPGGQDTMGEPFEIGTFRGSISGPTTVDVNVSYNSSAPKQMSCDEGVYGGVRLEVPIEMLAGTIGSDLAGFDRVFEKTRTRLNTNDYDGTVSYSFEIVAMNIDASPTSVTLVDSANNPVPGGTITLTPSMASNSRFIAQFFPPAGYNKYAVKIYGISGVTNQVKITQARILVRQSNATKTNLFFPLVTDSHSATADYQDNVSAFVNASGTYTNDGKFILFKKENSQFSQIASVNPWILEVVQYASTSTGCSRLYQNQTANAVGGGAPVEVCASSPAITHGEISFPDNATNFTDYSLFEMKTINNGTDSKLFRAGIWLRLENLAHGEVHYQVSRHAMLAPSTPLDNTYQRTVINWNWFSYPTYFHVVSASSTAAGAGFTGYIYSLGANDTDSIGTLVTGSDVLVTLTNANEKYRYRSPISFNLAAGDRVKFRTDTTGLSKDIAASFFVVKFHR